MAVKLCIDVYHSLDIKVSASMEKSWLTKKKKKPKPNPNSFSKNTFSPSRKKLVENFQFLLIAYSCLYQLATF